MARPYSTARGRRTGNPAWLSALAASDARRLWRRCETACRGRLVSTPRSPAASRRLATRPWPGRARRPARPALDQEMLPAEPMDLFDAGWPTCSRRACARPSRRPWCWPTVSADRGRGPDGAAEERLVPTVSPSIRTGPPARAADLAEVPRACVLFPWHAMHRQVIIEGPVTAADHAPRASPISIAARAAPSWARGPAGSRPCWRSRAELEDRYAELEQRWPEGLRCRCPISGAATCCVPEAIEFWQGRAEPAARPVPVPARGAWNVSRLSP